MLLASRTQGQQGRTLSGTFQMSQALACGGSVQIPGVDIELRRKYHTTSKLSSTKDSPQPVEEKVGAFTKIIEAMGFTGPLKYSKWKIKIAALRMYTSCVEKTDFEEFFLSKLLFLKVLKRKMNLLFIFVFVSWSDSALF